jgi:hypothetical protein
LEANELIVQLEFRIYGMEKRAAGLKVDWQGLETELYGLQEIIGHMILHCRTIILYDQDRLLCKVCHVTPATPLHQKAKNKRSWWWCLPKNESSAPQCYMEKC